MIDEADARSVAHQVAAGFRAGSAEFDLETFLAQLEFSACVVEQAHNAGIQVTVPAAECDGGDGVGVVGGCCRS